VDRLSSVPVTSPGLWDWFEFFGERELEWTRVRLEEVGRFMAWLRLPGMARAGNVTALSTAACALVRPVD